MNEAAAEAVARGSELLDGTYPDWGRHIDFDMLDMSSIFHCLLGQVEAGIHGITHRGSPWGDGMRRLFGDTDGRTGATYGFDVAYGCGFDLDELTEAWRVFLLGANA